MCLNQFEIFRKICKSEACYVFSECLSPAKTRLMVYRRLFMAELLCFQRLKMQVTKKVLNFKSDLEKCNWIDNLFKT